MTAGRWNAPAPSRAAGQPAVDATTAPPVRLLIVAQPGRSQAYYAAFVADARYAVQAVATSAADAKAKLALNPEAVMAEVVVFDGPTEFADIFGAYRGACFPILPAGLNQAEADAVRAVRSVQALVEGEPNFDPRFLELDNVLLQPHHASGTIETRKAMGQLMRDNLTAYFAGQELPTPVI